MRSYRARRHRRPPSPDALVLVAAVVGVLSLFAAAEWVAPPSIALGEVAAHESQRVALTARVLEARHGTSGRMLVVADEAHRGMVFAGLGVGPWPGDVVRVVGVVQRGADGYAVSADRIEVVEEAGARVASPVEIAREPDAYLGARVRVLGEWRAEDATLSGGGARLRVLGDAAPEAGWWIASGEVVYVSSDARFALRVDAWTPRS